MEPNEQRHSGFFSTLQVVYDFDRKSAALNMAVDEALLQTAREPILRFYNWRRPSLSFGYFGRLADAILEAGEREIVRRWTGGGIVRHDNDLTYSIILPRELGSAQPSPRELYNSIHRAIRDALSENPEIALASSDAPKQSEACFANAVTADVLCNGRKIAGAAQRRTRAGLLHQGSIQYENLPTDFPPRFVAELCAIAKEITLSSDLLSRAESLAIEKYGTTPWLQQR